MAHLNHPSVVALAKRQSVTQGKEVYLEQLLSDAEEKEKEQVVPSTITEERLQKFRPSGEKYFKVLVDSINTYKDKAFTITKSQHIFEKDDIIQGTYIDNKIVLFGAPYNTYCKANDVEPVDIDHKAYLHKQQERQRKNKRKHIAYNNRNDNNDNEYKMAHNDSEFEHDERARLMDEDNEQYIEEDADALISKRIVGILFFICAGILFLLLFVLDILLMLFLNALNSATKCMDDNICDGQQLAMVYDGKYLNIAVIGFCGLVLFCVFSYFGPMVSSLQQSVGKRILSGTVMVMVLLYFSICIWQMYFMKKDINTGINGLKHDSHCIAGDNVRCIQDMQDLYDNIGVVTILKVFQGVVLVLLALVVIWLRVCS